MENEVIDDTPEQGYLFSSEEDKEELNESGSDPGDWLDDMLSHDIVQTPPPGTVCNPDKCVEDCEKCNIFEQPPKG